MSESQFCFRLFVAGNEPNSRLAEQNLRKICREYLPEHHYIEVIDVLQNFKAALAAQIMVAPTLIVDSPRALILYGALTDEVKVLSAIGIGGNRHDR